MDTDSTAPSIPAVDDAEAAGRPIAEYALLSDCSSAALLHREGSIDWLCLPRFDSPSVFARILDWAKGGFFRVAPAHYYDVTRRYIANTNVLETRFKTADGVITVTDCLPVRIEEGHPDLLLEPGDLAADC